MGGLTMLARALRLRCPNCGGGPLFTLPWFALRERCPRCGLRPYRSEGYVTGSVAFNLIAAEGAFVLALVATAVLTWPAVPWDTLEWALPAGMVLFPILFYPWAKTLYLAFDLFLRPPEPHELGGPAEQLGRTA
jgi:uncharacterized protein (DUF983 family)